MSAAATRVPPPGTLAAEAMIEALPVAIYTTDAQGRITSFNDAAVAFWGHTPSLGEDQWCGGWRLYWSDGRPMNPDECPMVATLKTGRPVRDVEAIIERPDGSRAFFTPYPSPVLDENGAVTGGVNMLVDITDRKMAEQTREHFAAIVTSSDDAIISKDLNGIIHSWNKGAERVFGYTPEETIGQHISMLIPADRQNEEPGIIERIRRGERVDHYETIRKRKDSSLINVSLTVSPVKNSKGIVVGASKIARDITDRKRADEARELLLHEIKHRVKNTLGTVQAIASQTFRAAPREERDAFTARLRALSDAHDLLTRQNHEWVDAGDVITRALGPFQEKRGTRIQMTGGNVLLNAEQALLLAMALHELATNAVKYGALSNDDGIVQVDWTTRGEQARRLVVHWRESGGPPVATPARTGFGTILLQRALQREQGSSQIMFLPAGVDCTLEMKL